MQQPTYYSALLRLPQIPFVVMLPTVCFKVHMPLCMAAQRAYLKYFELMPGVGYRAFLFMADRNRFTVISQDCWALDFAPFEYGVNIEQPVIGIEAFALYACFLDKLRDDRMAQIIDDLNHDRVSAAYVKKRLPELLRYHHPRLAELKAAIAEQIWRNGHIKKQTSKGRMKDPDLVASYHFILDRQAKPNKAAAAREAVTLLNPHENQDTIDELAEKLLDSLKKGGKLLF